MVYKNPGITRSELCQSLNINKSIVTQLTGFLEEDGWIAASDARTKKQPLRLNPNRLRVAGVEIQPEHCDLAICDLDGKKLYEKTWKRDSGDLGSFLNVMLPYYLHESGLDIGALGIAMPGIIDTASHTLLASQPFRVTSPMTLPERIGSKSFPVFYDNDARCLGWGLISFRKEKGNFLLHYMQLVEHEPPTDEYRRIVHGMALFFDQKSFEGSHHRAGEVRMQSHLPYTDGIKAFGDYLTRLQLKNKPDVFKQYFDSLVFDISYVSTLVDVDKVFVFGSLRQYKSEFIERFSEVSERTSYYPELNAITVDFPELTHDSMTLGAAGMAIERLFSIPANEHPSDFYRAIAETRHG
jgi:hypothetical protein